MIDSRYRSGKPLIVTTNLTLDELKHTEDTANAASMTGFWNDVCPFESIT